MKAKLLKKPKFLGLLLILMILSSFLSPSAVSASHLCYGGTCHGKNPNTMGCGGDAAYGATIKSLFRSGVKIGEVHNRYSNHCLAQWERTLNLSSNQYAEGSIRWGGSNYSTGWQRVSSPGIIGYGVTVYTPMYGVNGGIGPSLNCGSLSLTGPISPPPQPVSAAYKSSNCQAR